MYKNSLLANSVRFALISGAAATAAMTAPTAFAAEEEAKVERISVTGSRIKRADMETASPVTIIDASAILASGATSIDGILQSMTSSGGAMTNAGINNGSRGNSRVNLRGLGSDRTLVLVNGRRMIASGTGAASSVDLNTIPVSMIQRIEVLKDGASAIYGTDAIAGVVNIITKRDFEGFEMNVQTGMSEHGDGEETSIDFTLGANHDKGNMVLNLQYTKRGDASQADRDFSNCPLSETGATGEKTLYCGGSSYSQGGHIWGDKNFDLVKSGIDEDGKAIIANGDASYYGQYITRLNSDGTEWTDDKGKANNKYFQTWRAITDPTSPYYNNSVDSTWGDRSVPDVSGRGDSYHDFVSSGDNNDKYNYAKDSYLSTPMERLNLTAAATYDLTDNLTFFTEAMYTKRWSDQQMAPQPIWNGDAWLYDPKSAGGWMTDELL
ncbi:TonB-dependent siderophore receptor, partial [Shewanella sp.]|uniref:TonB-dependent receptor plug domain-containing protein n=1 Tax=Shewanella sp. TaxID=50422 RepID=UPI001ED32DD4